MPSWFDSVLQCLWALFGSLAFGIFFHIRGKNLWLAAFTGFAGWAAYLLSACLLSNTVAQNFWGGFAISLLSEFFAVRRKCPVTVFLVTAMIPLVPGSTVYYAMEALFQGDISLFMQKGLLTLEIAGAIAMGILTVSFLVRLGKTFLFRMKVERLRRRSDYSAGH